MSLCCTRVGALYHIALGGNPHETCRYCGRTAQEIRADPSVPALLEAV